MIIPIQLLQRGAASLLPYFEPETGLLNDPVFGCPTQYSTPYYAWVNAVLAARSSGAESAAYAARAHAGLRAALAYLLDPSLPAYPSDFQRGSGAASGRNHRDFFWPAVLKTWQLLSQMGEPGYAHYGEQIARVDILAAFAQRPPSNWAMVWLSGEWLRIAAGRSPFSMEQFDEWLGAYFHGHLLLEQGFYQEPGHPNSYDLFTRVHLADILRASYGGRWRRDLQTLMRSGLRRSLAVQLSDGALASAHRSTGQAWTDGAQISFLTHAANLFQGEEPALAAAAREAAARAYHSLVRWQRPEGPFSPVHNLLPPELRVGYEVYTADGHYSTLALAFLATALHNGFDPASGPALQPRAPRTFIEHDPIWRALLHNGDTSLALTAFPAEHYDAFGITDLTFGPDRRLQFSSSVRTLESGRLINPGMALRPTLTQAGPISALAGLSELEAPLGENPMVIAPLQQGDTPASLRLAARPRGAYYSYQLEAQLGSSGVEVREATPGLTCRRTLLIPFVRDAGAGHVTRWQTAPGRLELSMGEELLAVEWQGPAERVVVLAQGFENRRGLCALARIDLADPSESLSWGVHRIH